MVFMFDDMLLDHRTNIVTFGYGFKFFNFWPRTTTKNDMNTEKWNLRMREEYWPAVECQPQQWARFNLESAFFGKNRTNKIVNEEIQFHPQRIQHKTSFAPVPTGYWTGTRERFWLLTQFQFACYCCCRWLHRISR